jgi:TonB-linked SusC/RagA family outer membrane protein
MEVEASDLSEVVVIGYGTQKKSDLTGAITQIGGNDLRKLPNSNIEQSMAGKIPGVAVTLTSGEPGSKPKVRIRGTTSLTGANNPLYVIDGVLMPSSNLPAGTSPMTFLDPGEIASVQVLKDASATAIYGSRGANGVIIITTKQGNSGGKGVATYNVFVSMGILPRELSTLNSEQFLEVEDIAFQNAQKYDPVGWANGKYTDPKLKRTDPRLFDANGKPLYNTDWQKEATQRAITQDHHLSFSHGDFDNNYRIDLGYHNEDGLLRNSWLKRYTGRITVNSKLNNWLSVGGFLNYNLEDQKRNNGPWVGRQLYESIPISPVKFPDGEWAGNEFYQGMEGGPNLIRVLEEVDNRYRTNTMLSNVFANIKIINGLEFRTQFSSVVINQENNLYQGRNISFLSKDQGGIATISNFSNTSWIFENQLTYAKTFNGKHEISALGAASWELNNQFSSRMRNMGYTSDYFKYNNIGTGSNVQPPSSARTADALNSFFGRINYTFNNKYLATITARADGSSKFGINNRYAFFPSGALGWKISEENFMKNISAISNFKLRASYGVTGNSEIGPYQAIGGLGNYIYSFGGQLVNGIGIGALANPNLRWEKNNQYNIGIDLGLFHERVQLTLDYYDRKSENSLLSAPVPSSSGYSSVAQNIGSIRNRGFELGLNSINIENANFRWNTVFNITFNQNRVLRLSEGRSSIITQPTIIQEGSAINSYFGFIRLGTWGKDEAVEAAKYGKRPGDLKYKDINNDGQINQNDRVILGNGLPDAYGALINVISYKNFSLTLDLEYQWGNDIFFATVTEEDRVGIANSLTTVLDGWTETNQNTPLQQIRPMAAGYSTAFPDADSRGVNDGSFIRGRNLQVAYNFPTSKIKNWHLTNLTIYASTQNFFLIEKPLLKKIIYDPTSMSDVISNDVFQEGVTQYNGQYPKPTVFTLGLNVNF